MVGLLCMNDGDVGPDRRDRRQLLAGERAFDELDLRNAVSTISSISPHQNSFGLLLTTDILTTDNYCYVIVVVVSLHISFSGKMTVPHILLAKISLYTISLYIPVLYTFCTTGTKINCLFLPTLNEKSFLPIIYLCPLH